MMSSSVPLSQMRSAVAASPRTSSTVVCVFRSAWFSVADSDEFTGRISASSRLPQYLIVAMFTGAVHVT
jgi:hypothetical protein